MKRNIWNLLLSIVLITIGLARCARAATMVSRGVAYEATQAAIPTPTTTPEPPSRGGLVAFLTAREDVHILATDVYMDDEYIDTFYWWVAGPDRDFAADVIYMEYNDREYGLAKFTDYVDNLPPDVVLYCVTDAPYIDARLAIYAANDISGETMCDAIDQAFAHQ